MLGKSLIYYIKRLEAYPSWAGLLIFLLYQVFIKAYDYQESHSVLSDLVLQLPSDAHTLSLTRMIQLHLLKLMSIVNEKNELTSMSVGGLFTASYFC